MINFEVVKDHYSDLIKSSGTHNFLGSENEIPVLNFVTSIGEAKIDLRLTYIDGVADFIFSKCLIEDPYNESWREKITSAGDAFDPIYHDYSNVILFYKHDMERLRL